MSAVGLLYSIHRERADGVDAEAVELTLFGGLVGKSILRPHRHRARQALRADLFFFRSSCLDYSPVAAFPVLLVGCPADSTLT